MSRTAKPIEVTADELKIGDRLWFKYQVSGQDYITSIWVLPETSDSNTRIKVQCDLRSSSREYDPGALVQIHPRKKKKVNPRK